MNKLAAALCILAFVASSPADIDGKLMSPVVKPDMGKYEKLGKTHPFKVQLVIKKGKQAVVLDQKSLDGQLAQSGNDFTYAIPYFLPELDGDQPSHLVVTTTIEYAGKPQKLMDEIELTEQLLKSLRRESASHKEATSEKVKYRPITPGFGFTLGFSGLDRYSIGGGKITRVRDKYAPATTAFIHFPLSPELIRKSEDQRIGLTIGTPLTGARGYIAGFTWLTTGEKSGSSIAITFGAMFANQTILSPGYNVGDAYAGPNAPTTNRRNVSFMIGFSYAIR